MGSLIPDIASGTIKIAIDRGGTFTDVWASAPGKADIVLKLLSVDPGNYSDAPTEGIRRVLSTYLGTEIPRGVPLPKRDLQVVRMGTTVATNALLERKGTRHAFLVTKGFRDLLRIGYQSRPRLFDLDIKKPEVLFSEVREIDERVTIEGFDEDIDGIMKAEKEIPGVLVRGSSGDMIRILKSLDEEAVKKILAELRQDGIDTVAVCFTHSHIFAKHEQRVGQLALDAGFNHVSLSSEVAANMIKMVPRGSSASADAYLTPEIKNYLRGFVEGFEGGHLDDTRVDFMQSDGGLVSHKNFTGLKGILSGPAGGVVGCARTCYENLTKTPIVCFDMGGTSTDVSRYGGVLEHVFESTTAGVTIQSPQLDINTVAAGGGSILTWRNRLFAVGPESASSHPGPACYRKGGPLAVTDANLFLGRLVPDFFPKIFGASEKEPLDFEVVKEKFVNLTAEINAETGQFMTPEEIAFGFLDVANEAMCRPIRSLTEGKGYAISNHRLGVFGGAGGQHACEIAAKLGISTIVIHKYSSILSAYGMALADVVDEAQEPTNEVYGPSSKLRLEERIGLLKTKVCRSLVCQGVREQDIGFDCYLNMRYQGTETPMMVLRPEDGDYEAEFVRVHEREFSFVLEGRPILVDDARVRGTGYSGTTGTDGESLGRELTTMKCVPSVKKQVDREIDAYFHVGGKQRTPVYLLKDLPAGTSVLGPAMIIDNTQTLVVVPHAKARILTSHVVIDLATTKTKALASATVIDPIHLSVFGHRFMSIAEQMGRTLQKTSVSLNIKERLDFSCAIFGPDAGLVANAPHIPVHLGSMSFAVKYQHELHKGQLRPGDVLLSNHPESGGTHLPDLTVITPVFDGNDKEIAFYVAARGHHTDIGGFGGSSMPSNSTELWQEGAAIRSFKLIHGHEFDEEGIIKILQQPGELPGCTGSRRLGDNLSDLKAQVAANNKGAVLIKGLMEEYSQEVVHLYMQGIQNNAEVAVRAYLSEYRQEHGSRLVAEDYMDNGSIMRLAVDIETDGSATFDFTGTTCEMLSNLNAPPAITHSAMLYTLRLLIGTDIPMNQGCLKPITINIPKGSFLNPSTGPAVCAGNTQTSQRVCDVILKAFNAAGASQGCMNCLGFFGEGGVDKDGKKLSGYAYAFGETIAGGSGATSRQHGASAVAIHMTNTRITDPESMEKRYPVLLNEFSIRANSGGRGTHNGGNGTIRSYECRAPLSFSVITERRVIPPYGSDGGGQGERGANYWVKRNSDGSERWVNLGPKNMVSMAVGDRCVIHTPGGGGWGGLSQTNGLANGNMNAMKPNSSVHVPRASGSLAAFEEVQATSN